MKVYTKTGDSGKTSLFSGERVYKHFPEISLVGSIDELQSFIGLVKTAKIKSSDKKTLQEIQQDLYQIMGHISGAKIEISTLNNKINLFEQIIDKLSVGQVKQDSFILPGSTEISAKLHILRTICRRTEREMIKFFFEKKILDEKHSQLLISYFNRLSDLFYTLARKYEK